MKEHDGKLGLARTDRMSLDQLSVVGIRTYARYGRWGPVLGAIIIRLGHYRHWNWSCWL